jgi:NADH-quinone oxidoreductase subunit J
MFGPYLIAFEVTAALLITAAMGAMILTHRERWMPKRTQRELSQERFASGAHPGQLPPPGVYARHNAVDTPALLPDGSTSDISVPEPLRVRDDIRDVDPAEIDEVRQLSADSSGEDDGR